MLNTQKLLFILPDLAYAAELLPAKKEYTFTVQAFRQINGEYSNESDFIPTNIDKLFSKIDKEEYHLILPDFLFTNTIVNMTGTSEASVLDHVNKILLPELDLNKQTHEIETTVLTSFKGVSKIQISAIEKSLLAPLRAAAQEHGVTITAISPLSWCLKSIISLEPSISVVQLGSHLFSAEHYIGIDQANNFPVSEYESIVETIKTLKGAEPSIQTIYIVSSSLIEEDIKQKLSNTLPIQQLATFKDDDAKMPSYVRFVIESCMKTLAIPDFPVPKFKLGKATQEDLETLRLENQTEKVSAADDDEEEKTVNSDIPLPSVISEPDLPELPTPSVVETLPVVTQKVEEEEIEDTNIMSENLEKEDELISQFATKDVETEVEDIDTQADTDIVNKKEPYAPQVSDLEEEIDPITMPAHSTHHVETVTAPETKKIIKNSSGVNNMLKMVFITVAVFFLTIAVGVGVGLGILKLSGEKQTAEPEQVVVTQTPTPTPTPSPTPTPEVVDKETLSILVVNATTKAGYAGKIKTLLTTSEIEDVDTGNAKGEYEAGMYVLMTKENAALIKILEESTKLTLEYADTIKTEDPGSNYDAVIVLAE